MSFVISAVTTTQCSMKKLEKLELTKSHRPNVELDAPCWAADGRWTGARGLARRILPHPWCPASTCAHLVNQTPAGILSFWPNSAISFQSRSFACTNWAIGFVGYRFHCIGFVVQGVHV